MKNRSLLLIKATLCIAIFTHSALAQVTEFTYQGSLKNGGAAATGNFDFEFLLYDSLAGGTQVAPTLTKSSVAVANGTFSVKLDFGASYPGADRFLEIHIRQTGGGAFTPLAPRQSVSSTPYSVKSLNADNATNAVNATNATNAVSATTATNSEQLGGLPAYQYVLTGDPRLFDARVPAAGSPNYIQNTASPQASSNLNISGNGIFGGNVGIGTNNPQYRLDAQTGTGAAISGTSSSSSPIGVIGTATSPSVNFGMAHAAPAGVWGTSAIGTGVEGSSDSNAGVVGESSSNVGVLGTSTTNVGVFGFTQGITGVYGRVDNPSARFGSAYIGKAGVWGTSSSSPGVYGTSDSNVGVVGISDTNIGVLGRSYSGYAGYFDGTVVVVNLATGGGSTVCRNSSNQLSSCASSSLRYKKNISAFGTGLNVVTRLKPIAFTWKSDGTSDFGLGAEDVEKVDPNLVFYKDGQIEGVKYDRIGVVLINAVKEQQAQIEAQTAQIDRLNAANKKQESDIEALRTLVCRAHRRATVCRAKN